MFGNGRNHLKESRTRHKDDLSIDIVIKGHRMLEELTCCLTPEQKIKFECYINSNYELSKSLTLKSLKENPVPLIRYAILTDDLKMLATVMFWSSFFQDNDSDLIKGRRDTRLTNFDYLAKFGMTLKDFVSNYKIDNPRMNLTRVKNRLPELLKEEKSLLVCNAPGYDSIEQFSYDTPSRLVIVPNFPILYFMAKSTGVELVPLVGLCSKEYKVELFLNKKRPFFLGFKGLYIENSSDVFIDNDRRSAFYGGGHDSEHAMFDGSMTSVIHDAFNVSVLATDSFFKNNRSTIKIKGYQLPETTRNFTLYDYNKLIDGFTDSIFLNLKTNFPSYYDIKLNASTAAEIEQLYFTLFVAAGMYYQRQYCYKGSEAELALHLSEPFYKRKERNKLISNITYNDIYQAIIQQTNFKDYLDRSIKLYR